MKILTLTGPSCSGKTTLLNELVEKHGFQSIVSHTTRPMRPGEVYGKDYYFVPQKIFDMMNENAMFIETVSFNGFSYGVSMDEIQAAHASGKVAVLIVEPTGLIQILQYVENNPGIEVASVYIGGNAHDLTTRYLKRLTGEDLTIEGVAERHAKRLHSMIKEIVEWRPLDCGDVKIPADAMCMNIIPYTVNLKDLGPNNFQDTITIIKGLL